MTQGAEQERGRELLSLCDVFPTFDLVDCSSLHRMTAPRVPRRKVVPRSGGWEWVRARQSANSHVTELCWGSRQYHHCISPHRPLRRRPSLLPVLFHRSKGEIRVVPAVPALFPQASSSRCTLQISSPPTILLYSAHSQPTLSCRPLVLTLSAADPISRISITSCLP